MKNTTSKIFRSECNGDGNIVIEIVRDAII